MSKTMAPLAIMAAIVKAEENLRLDKRWTTVNDKQAYFTNYILPNRAELSRFSEGEILNCVSRDVRRLNEFLQGAGFDVRFEPFQQTEIGIVSILDLSLLWLTEGDKKSLMFQEESYPAVCLARRTRKRKENGERSWETLFDAFELSSYPYPIALVYTQSKDRLYMCVADNEPVGDFSLMHKIDEIRDGLQGKQPELGYDYLKFPMVSLDQKRQIDWFSGMHTSVVSQEFATEPIFIRAAMQQTKFKMNELGAHASIGVMLGVVAGAGGDLQELKIDKPFFLWIEREGVSIPVFYAHISEQDWKNPGDL